MLSDSCVQSEHVGRGSMGVAGKLEHTWDWRLGSYVHVVTGSTCATDDLEYMWSGAACMKGDAGEGRCSV